MFEYKCELDRVVDGDTVYAWVDLGFGIRMHKSIRLFGINAWENRTKDLEEKEKGKLAKLWLQDQINKNGGEFTIHTEKDSTGKYGRLLATIYIDTSAIRRNINKELIQEGHAVVYK